MGFIEIKVIQVIFKIVEEVNLNAVGVLRRNGA